MARIWVWAGGEEAQIYDGETWLGQDDHCYMAEYADSTPRLETDPTDNLDLLRHYRGNGEGPATTTYSYKGVLQATQADAVAANNTDPLNTLPGQLIEPTPFE
jgi:hypothetical protein